MNFAPKDTKQRDQVAQSNKVEVIVEELRVYIKH